MKKSLLVSLMLLLAALACQARGSVKRVLFIGDSMTGWLAERLEAYGALNDFEVSTVIWDGSTLPKWVNSGKIPSLIKTYKPDAVFICLGLNEILAKDMNARLSKPVAALEQQLGGIPYVWVGPPTWPGKSTGQAFNDWMHTHIHGTGHYFDSQALQLPRQSTVNPHPTRAACASWMDAVVRWLPSADIGFPASMTQPASGEMKRGKVYVYRRMKQSL